MRLTTTPRPYEALYRGVFYEIEANPSEVIELHTTAVGTPNEGLKRMSGQTNYRVNIAPYLYEAVSFEPNIAGTSGIFVMNSRLVNCLIDATCFIDNVAISTVKNSSQMTLAAREIIFGKMLSDAPMRRKIATNGSDEICFMVDNKSVSASINIEIAGGSVIKQNLNSLSNVAGYVCVNINASDIIQKISSNAKALKFIVEIQIGTAAPVLVEYSVSTPTKDMVTLKWINAYGAIDSYNFEHLRNDTKTHGKRRLLNDNGYRVIIGGVEHTTTVAGEFETAETTDWLGSIISSPKVWNCADGVSQNVEILTDKIVSQRGQLCRMELTMKSMASDPIQTM